MNIRAQLCSFIQYSESFGMVCNGMLEDYYFASRDFFDLHSAIFVRYEH